MKKLYFPTTCCLLFLLTNIKEGKCQSGASLDDSDGGKTLDKMLEFSSSLTLGVTKAVLFAVGYSDEFDCHKSAEKYVNFYLYTPEQSSGILDGVQLKIGDTSTLKGSTFIASRPTKVLIHGYGNNHLTPMPQVIKNAYLDNGFNVNVISVDWGFFAMLPYYTRAVDCLVPVGQQVAKLIDFLVTQGGAKVADFHLIGHSLGSHVSAFTANNVTTGKIPRITGMDPARPLLNHRPASARLDPTDATLVDCIHTCGGYWGLFQSVCTQDYYPNSGCSSQPGCSIGDATLFNIPSHARAYDLYAASVTNSFPAVSCSSVEAASTGSCSGNATGLMGSSASSAKPGIYYLKTSGVSPFTVA